MPLCLLCPTGNQPSFVGMSELSNHISEVHSIVPHKLAGPPRRPATTVKCSTCNKKFATSGALSSHQSAKKHIPSEPVPTCKPASSKELAHQPEAQGASSPLPALIGSASAEISDVTDHHIIHSCNECQANFGTLTQLEAHRSSSHKKFTCSKCTFLSYSLREWNNHFRLTHANTQSSCSRPAEVPPDTRIFSPHPTPSPAIVCLANSQPVASKSASPNPNGKGLVCDVCNKAVKGITGLQAHKAAKHPSRAECVICHLICSSTAVLEKHVDNVHSCAVCHDGILRDALTLSDHMVEHSHPILCKSCGTRYQTVEERQLHFAAEDNDHPVCVACRLGFVDDGTLQAHMSLAHPTSPQPSPKPSSRRFSAEHDIDTHEHTDHHCVVQCDVCHEAYLSQTELDVHIVTVHSCPICHDGIYMDMRSLEEHLEQHRSPYVCRPCGLAYAEEDQLHEHYKTSPSDIHPHCEKCQLGFENNEVYAVHVDEVHPRVACDVCSGDYFDQGELAAHYLSSRKHPKCEKCGIGFKDRFNYSNHGASAHPECHCHLCHWHFDTPEILQNHIRQFFNHPKCQECNIRFVDADSYQYHLFAVHRPHFGDQGHFGTSVVLHHEEKISKCDFSSPLPSTRALDPVLGFEGSTVLSCASYIPSPPSLSGHSSPTPQRAIADPGGSSGSHSRSSTLSVEQRSPTDGQPYVTIQSPSLDVGQDPETSPDFKNSPLSTLPAVGTPIISATPTIQSADLFSPRPEPPPLFSLSQGITDAAITVVDHDDTDSDSSNSFTHSPPLVSPVVKLPDPGPISPSSTSSSWTMGSDADSRRSSPHHSSISSSTGIHSAFTAGQSTTSGHTIPQLTLLVPSSTTNSGCPSSISPESAGISVSATMTPEYIREARAYLSLTHQVQEPVPPNLHSPGLSSPVLSSTGLATIGERGRRREVRFEDNIMSEAAWDRHSTSSDSSLEPPVILPRPSALRLNGVSKLPRFSALRRPNRRCTNGQANHVYSRGYNRRQNGAPSPSYHCRSCYKDHCEEPTTTTCGHLFCYDCISTAVMKDARCPVCEAPTLLYCLFRIDISS